MITGTIVGTLTGLLGTAFTAWNNRKVKALEIKDKELDRAHELSMVKANTEAMIKEVEANIRVTETTIAGEIEKQDVAMFADVQKLANESMFKESYMERLESTMFGKIIGTILGLLFGLVDVLRTAMRPIITITLITMTYSYANASEIDDLTLEYLVGLTTTAVVWWFGHRSVNTTNIKK